MLLRVLLILVGLAACGRGDSLTQIPGTRGVRLEQKLGAQIPMNLSFIDDTGKPVRLGECFHGQPVLLVLDYYRCPNLCSIVLNSLVTSLQDLKFNAGDRYEVMVVSIDPTDTARMSAQKKMGYVDLYQRPQTAGAWHFLTGRPGEISALAAAVGFHYTYDPATKQFAHPSGMIVLTPDGRTSRYFYGIEFPPHGISDALRVAAASRINSPVYELLLLCCQYNPLQGKFGSLIFSCLQVAGIGSLLAMGLYIARALRTEFKAPPTGGAQR